MSTEQEYDAQPSSILDNEADSSDQPAAPAPEPGHYQSSQYQHQMPPHSVAHNQQYPAAHSQSKAAVQGHERGQAGETNGSNQLFDPYDPMLDADPFGLSASMHFPTNYSFDQPAQR